MALREEINGSKFADVSPANVGNIDLGGVQFGDIRRLSTGQLLSAVTSLATLTGLTPATIQETIADSDNLLSAFNKLAFMSGKRWAAGVIRPTLPPNPGDPISWAFLNQSDNHDSIYFSGTITGNAIQGTISVEFPNVSDVITCIAVTDEVLASNGLFLGCVGNIDEIIISAFQRYDVAGRVIDDGAGGLTGSINGANFAYDSVSGTVTLTATQPYNQYGLSAVVSGSLNYYLRFETGGLGSGEMKFKFIDPTTGTALTGPIPAGLGFYVGGPGFNSALNLAVRSSLNETILTGFSNIWLLCLFNA